MNRSGFPGEPYSVLVWTPIVALATALAFKLPSIVRLWRDPLLRAVGGLLLLACAVFVFAAPPTIAWTNRVTGVPNIAAPWVYSLHRRVLRSGLLLVIALARRSDRALGPAAETRRATRWVVSLYAGVIVALWALFALADVPVERTAGPGHVLRHHALHARGDRSLPARAHHVLCPHVPADLELDPHRRTRRVAALGTEVPGRRLRRQPAVRRGEAARPSCARWAGRDLDPLSTQLAPAVGGVAAVLIAIGFILPHAGQFLHDRWRVRRAHLRLARCTG